MFSIKEDTHMNKLILYIDIVDFLKKIQSTSYASIIGNIWKRKLDKSLFLAKQKTNPIKTNERHINKDTE